MRICLFTVIDKINKFLFIQFLQVIKLRVSYCENKWYASLSLLIFSLRVYQIHLIPRRMRKIYIKEDLLS